MGFRFNICLVYVRFSNFVPYVD